MVENVYKISGNGLEIRKQIEVKCSNCVKHWHISTEPVAHRDGSMPLILCKPCFQKTRAR